MMLPIAVKRAMVVCKDFAYLWRFGYHPNDIAKVRWILNELAKVNIMEDVDLDEIKQYANELGYSKDGVKFFCEEAKKVKEGKVLRPVKEDIGLNMDNARKQIFSG